MKREKDLYLGPKLSIIAAGFTTAAMILGLLNSSSEAGRLGYIIIGTFSFALMCIGVVFLLKGRKRS